MMKEFINNPQKTKVAVSLKSQIAYMQTIFYLASIRGNN